MSASFPVPDAAFRFLMDIRTPITPAQITRTAAGILTGRIPLKAFSEKITRYRNRVNASTTDFFHSLMTACRIKTQTHTRIPAKACCTTGRSAKFDKNVARTRMIMIGPVRKPTVAQSAPATPPFFSPIGQKADSSAERARHSALFLPDKSGDVERYDSGRTLSDGKIVPKVIHCRPMPLVNKFPFKKRKHRIASTKVDAADPDESNVKIQKFVHRGPFRKSAPASQTPALRKNQHTSPKRWRLKTSSRVPNASRSGLWLARGVSRLGQPGKKITASQVSKLPCCL